MKRSWTTFAALVALSSGCAAEAARQDAGRVGNPQPTEEAVVAAAEAQAQAQAEASPVAVARSLHHAGITEVVLDPRGEAALTIDSGGGVRLWPELGTDAKSDPIEIPAFEPVWMSLARSSNGYVAAFIDTAGGTQVGRVTVGEQDGPMWTPLFSRSATDPQFELHVLDGGERILALGVDHRIQVWDTRGETVAMMDEQGFVPWQLRVSQPEGEDPKILAVVAGPVRVQSLAFDGTSLSREGEPRVVALDRGPNRNDLVMSPDGTTVTALRRPKSREPRFELEIINVASGDRTIIAADSDTAKRPRVHMIDATRVLMESGTGQGFYVDLEAGVPWPPADGDPDRTLIEATALSMFALPGSTQKSRMHSTVVDGVRVVPLDNGLVVDALGEDKHHTLEKAGFRATAVALDATGERVAWGSAKSIVVEPTSGVGALAKLDGTKGSLSQLAFVGETGLVTLDSAGRVSLRNLEGSDEVASKRIPVDWGLSGAGWRAGEDGSSGQLVLASTRPNSALAALNVTESALGAASEIAAGERALWPEGGKPRGVESSTWIERLGMSWGELDLRVAEVKFTEPSPDGALLAIAQKTEHVSFFDEEVDAWVEGPHNFVITVVDRESSKPLWTARAHGLGDMAWSGDGKRFGYADGRGGHVLVGATGSVVHERRDLGIVVTTAED